MDLKAFFDEARELDRTDPLRRFRQQLAHPEENLIYLDGNSLGRLPVKTIARMYELVREDWGRQLIRGWNDGWYDLPLRLGNKIARLIGAGEGSVLVADSTSVNLFKLASAALRYQQGRRKIISDVLNFPTDLYILQGLLQSGGNGHTLHLAGSSDGITPDIKELEHCIDQETALVVLSLVSFKSAYFYEMQAINDMAHQNGALVLWDLSHAAGAVPVHLDRTGTDLAVGCTYKYLNGGPGSPAFLYVRRELQDVLMNPIQGWFGEHDPFAFELNYLPATGISRFAVGSPPILSMAAIEPGLDLLLEAGIIALREKSLHQSAFLIRLADELLAPLGVSVASPRDGARRGSHVSLTHPEAWRIIQALLQPLDDQPVIIPDFRAPDNIRIGITPLYTTFEELFVVIRRIRDILTTGEHTRHSNDRSGVT